MSSRLTRRQQEALILIARYASDGGAYEASETSDEGDYCFIHPATAYALHGHGLIRFGQWDPDGRAVFLTAAGKLKARDLAEKRESPR